MPYPHVIFHRARGRAQCFSLDGDLVVCNGQKIGRVVERTEHFNFSIYEPRLEDVSILGQAQCGALCGTQKQAFRFVVNAYIFKQYQTENTKNGNTL